MVFIPSEDFCGPVLNVYSRKDTTHGLGSDVHILIFCLLLNIVLISAETLCICAWGSDLESVSFSQRGQTLTGVLRGDSVRTETPHRPLTADSSPCWS